MELRKLFCIAGWSLTTACTTSLSAPEQVYGWCKEFSQKPDVYNASISARFFSFAGAYGIKAGLRVCSLNKSNQSQFYADAGAISKCKTSAYQNDIPSGNCRIYSRNGVLAPWARQVADSGGTLEFDGYQLIEMSEASGNKVVVQNGAPVGVAGRDVFLLVSPVDPLWSSWEGKPKFQVVAVNKSSKPVTFGIQNIKASSAGKRLQVPLVSERVRAQKRANAANTALGFLSAFGAGAMAASGGVDAALTASVLQQHSVNISKSISLSGKETDARIDEFKTTMLQDSMTLQPGEKTGGFFVISKPAGSTVDFEIEIDGKPHEFTATFEKFD